MPIIMMGLVTPNQTRHQLHDPTEGGAVQPSLVTTHHTRIEDEEAVVDANSVLSSRRPDLPVPLRNRPTAQDRVAGLRRLSTNGPNNLQRRKPSLPL